MASTKRRCLSLISLVGAIWKMLLRPSIHTFFFWSCMIYFICGSSLLVLGPSADNFFCTVRPQRASGGKGCGNCSSKLLLCSKGGCWRHAFNVTFQSNASDAQEALYEAFQDASTDTVCNGLITRDVVDPVDMIAAIIRAEVLQNTPILASCKKFHCGIVKNALIRDSDLNSATGVCANVRGSKPRAQVDVCPCSFLLQSDRYWSLGELTSIPTVSPLGIQNSTWGAATASLFEVCGGQPFLVEMQSACEWWKIGYPRWCPTTTITSTTRTTTQSSSTTSTTVARRLEGPDEEDHPPGSPEAPVPAEAPPEAPEAAWEAAEAAAWSSAEDGGDGSSSYDDGVEDWRESVKDGVPGKVWSAAEIANAQMIVDTLLDKDKRCGGVEPCDDYPDGKPEEGDDEEGPVPELAREQQPRRLQTDPAASPTPAASTGVNNDDLDDYSVGDWGRCTCYQQCTNGVQTRLVECLADQCKSPKPAAVTSCRCAHCARCDIDMRLLVLGVIYFHQAFLALVVFICYLRASGQTEDDFIRLGLLQKVNGFYSKQLPPLLRWLVLVQLFQVVWLLVDTFLGGVAQDYIGNGSADCFASKDLRTGSTIVGILWVVQVFMGRFTKTYARKPDWLYAPERSAGGFVSKSFKKFFRCLGP